MNTYIVLLRGINVGGNNLLPMKDLKELLVDIGFKNVSTYIQTGNIVLDGTKTLLGKIGESINATFGFTPEILVLSKSDFQAAITKNPYPSFEGKAVHFYFCAQPAKLNNEKLEALTVDTESHKLIGKVFYLHAPDGIGRSKLVKSIELCLGVSATGRNLNTINKLNNMLS